MTAAATFAVILVALSVGQATTPTEAHWAWFGKHRAKLLDTLMPMAPETMRVAAYRSYHDIDPAVHELYFEISEVRQPTGALRLAGTLVSPGKTSFGQQVLNMHMTDPRATFESMLPNLSVERFSVTEARCPAIRQRIEALSKTSFTLPDWNIVILHPVHHEFVINTGSVMITATVTDSKSQPVDWAIQTAKLIRACGA